MKRPFPLPFSNLTTLLLLGSQVKGKKPRPPNPERIRRFMYQHKILGMFWFEGSIPVDPTQPVRFYIDDTWPSGPPPDDIDEIMALSEADLEERCNTMKIPAWVKRRGIPGEVKLSDMLSAWQRMQAKKS